MRWIEEELKRIKEANLYRERILLEGVKDFCSNDYLGLRKHPEVVEESIRVLKEAGLGSGASQLVSGYTKHHRELEEKLAEFKGTESCVLFGSGFLANVGTIPALVEEGDLVLSDELNHASIIDGVRLSKAQKRVFKHKDYEELEEFLKKNRKKFRRVLIITDTVFSMDGDVADLKRLTQICEEYDCMLYIDEAHTTGTIGKGGLDYFGIEHKEYIIVMGTLSKALGSYGAFVCGTKLLIDYLVNKARSLIFSTSLPPSVCAGAKKAIEIIEENPKLIEFLRKKEKEILEILEQFSLDYKYYSTPIIPIMVYDEKETVRIKEELLKEGVFIQAIRYPTVPKGKARLRLTASLNYTRKDLEFLKNALEKVLKGRA
ncbi:8-amino-7-oxononanoate synthase [Aquifex aeolicus]|uniref:Putative 8-amino-7-oxononanoate synthase n=1 Tax=Aquifex aeolicus (strain VF5) TaxID=224324 RepID=BIOF_AQUAE|nr:8-amino-7-oxononanoate synthase [Aquifex aeolicus]O66875.1 RecName: Full=Putative 8-amino-7-oxononanoate synthase; Short=AONS; AltName: Full=7-keto-8-amino-pelargonic acid synthase; Short=7-KAP synthase; AltName: Full=8-amino-7-ketopelargonate synthase [Aquifex aeolicus VF5]AAC06836.1 8-amino-7-oxononanoate synthase [Aquifex aeolicus VF5]